MIIACIQSKGGVGKTTTAVNLSHALTRHQQKVLLIDLDSQGSASLSLGVSRTDLSPSIAEVLLEDSLIEEAIRETSIEGLSLITGSMSLANFDVNATQDKKKRTELLKDGIKSIIPNFDTIILDCPPSMGLLPINALIACDQYIIPTQPHYLALEGLVNLLEAIDRIKAGFGAKSELLGILLTLCDRRAKSTTEISNIIRNQFQNAVFQTEIGTNIKLAEAPSFGKTIFEHDWSSTGAEAYQSLAKEIINKTDKANHGKTSKQKTSKPAVKAQNRKKR